VFAYRVSGAGPLLRIVRHKLAAPASMGNFYTNYTLKGPSQQTVAAALAGRSAIVTPVRDGCVVVFDQASDDQDSAVIAELASRLSQRFSCPVLAVLNHDDDIFWYQLYLSGELADEYDSSPGYFDASAEPSAPVGGDSERLCSAFGANSQTTVEAVLRKSSYDDDGYVFAFQRHADLVRALNIPDWAVGTGYASFECDEVPEGLSISTILRTT